MVCGLTAMIDDLLAASTACPATALHSSPRLAAVPLSVETVCALH